MLRHILPPAEAASQEWTLIGPFNRYAVLARPPVTLDGAKLMRWSPFWFGCSSLLQPELIWKRESLLCRAHSTHSRITVAKVRSSRDISEPGTPHTGKCRQTQVHKGRWTQMCCDLRLSTPWRIWSAAFIVHEMPLLTQQLPADLALIPCHQVPKCGIGSLRRCFSWQEIGLSPKNQTHLQWCIIFKKVLTLPTSVILWFAAWHFNEFY